jgi:ATPase subunit of ABC transporter with duplicated ATPase domains
MNPNRELTVAEQNLQKLIELTDRLALVMAADAAAFEARRPHEAASRMEETARLANLYRHEAARVKADPAMIETANPKLRDRLKQATIAFETTLARHGRALHAAKTVTEGVVRAIAEEVARNRTANTGYGASGRQGAGESTAITLNKQA